MKISRLNSNNSDKKIKKYDFHKKSKTEIAACLLGSAAVTTALYTSKSKEPVIDFLRFGNCLEVFKKKSSKASKILTVAAILLDFAFYYSLGSAIFMVIHKKRAQKTNNQA